MKKKGKKKIDDQKLVQIIIQDQITIGESSSVNDTKGINVSVELLEKKIREIKYFRDNDAEARADKNVELLPVLERILKLSKEAIKKEDSDDDENQAARVLASRFGEADGSSRGEGERGYFESVSGFLGTWKGLASERRKEGSKSLIEMIQGIDRSDGEGTRVSDTMKETLVDIGSRISDLITEYLWLCAGTLDDSETAARTRIVKDTVLMVRLGMFGSAVVKSCVNMIELADQNIRASKVLKGKGKVVDDNEGRNDDVSFGERESRLLGSIFFCVLNLEAAFYCPSFQEKLENKDLMATKDFLRKLFEEKFNRLSSELNEFKKACKSTGELEELQREMS